MFEKQKREINSDYVKWIHEWGCIVGGCGRSWPVQAHHVKTRGAGGSDFGCVPLCHDHHRRAHDLGKLSFESKYHINFSAEIERLNRFFHEGKRGPYSEQVENLYLQNGWNHFRAS